MYNVETLYKARSEAIKFYDDYSLMMSEAKTKATKGTGLKILTSKQMLQRLPIALAQVKAGNNSESLLNEIRKIVYSLYQSKKITKKVHNNIIKSINILVKRTLVALQRIKMDTIFINSDNSKTPKPHILILKLTNKLDLRIGFRNKFLFCQILAFITRGKTQKAHTITIN